MKLYSWNVNGIRALIKKGAFQSFIDEHQPDILCLQETKAKPDQVSLDLPGYEQYWNSADKAGYSGTAIFSKIKPVSVLIGFSEETSRQHNLAGDAYGNPTREGRVISAEFADFWVVTVYTPNSKDDNSRLSLRHQQWDPAFLTHVKLLEKTKPVLICGDLNVAHTELDLARPKENIGRHGFTHEERFGFGQLVEAGFIDTYRDKYPLVAGAYTWWSHWSNARARNIGWRIDYWLASKALMTRINNPQIHAQVMGSDHCPVSIVLSD